jgi:hypothetical protein
MNYITKSISIEPPYGVFSWVRLDVDIQARNLELVFGLVQFSYLGGRGIVT